MEFTQETEKKPPQLARTPDVAKFRDAYRTPCAGCPSMLAIPLPYAHCVSCHNRWRTRGLKAPNKCPACHFNLALWRARNNVPARDNSTALIA
jgi:hypothetical protein